MSYFTQDFLDFYTELAGNNHKDWFDLNRKRYEKSIKIPFQEFVQHMINRIAELDSSFKDVLSKDCIFRINRDIRFSKDKTPYKLMSSAVVASHGKKSKAINGIYFEFGPEHVRVYGGIYELEKDDLEEIREGIAANRDAFRVAVNDANFKATFGEIHGEKNKILPAHLREAGQLEPLIFNKQWYFYKTFPAEFLLDENLDTALLDCYKAGRPIENFLNQFIQRP